MNQEINLIETESTSVAERVKALKIIDQASYEIGASLKISLSGLRKKIQIYWTPKVSKCKEAYDTMKNARDEMLKPPVAVEDELKGKLKGYEREKEKEAEDARMVAEVERRKKQEEAEAKAKEEAEVFGVDVKEVPVEEVEVEQPLPTIQKVVGLGIRKTWGFEITDPYLVPRQYLIPDLIAIGKKVREDKENTKIPGVRVFEK